MSLKKKYEKNFLLSDFLISVILISIVILLSNVLWESSEIESWIMFRYSEFYTLLTTISGTLLGFVITGVAILLVFPSSERLKELRKSKHFKTIYDVYFSSIKFLALTLIFSFIGFLCDENFILLIFYIVIWLTIISILRIWRCYWILKNIIDIVER
jgi:hypothetical protein